MSWLKRPSPFWVTLLVAGLAVCAYLFAPRLVDTPRPAARVRPVVASAPPVDAQAAARARGRDGSYVAPEVTITPLPPPRPRRWANTGGIPPVLPRRYAVRSTPWSSPGDWQSRVERETRHARREWQRAQRKLAAENRRAARELDRALRGLEHGDRWLESLVRSLSH